MWSAPIDWNASHFGAISLWWHAWASVCIAGKAAQAHASTSDEDIDTMALLSSDSEEEGITLANAPDAPGKGCAL
jgi:hypothetical protein